MSSTTNSSSARATPSPQHSTDATTSSSGPVHKTPDAHNIDGNIDTPLTLRPTYQRSNPFTHLAAWHALGFEDPHTLPEVDVSYIAPETPLIATKQRTPTPPTTTSQQPVTNVKARWMGSELFNYCHRPLAPGQSIFDPSVTEKQRDTQLLGFRKKVLPPLWTGGQEAESGRRGARGGRGRGHGRFRSSFC